MRNVSVVRVATACEVSFGVANNHLDSGVRNGTRLELSQLVLLIYKLNSIYAPFVEYLPFSLVAYI